MFENIWKHLIRLSAWNSRACTSYTSCIAAENDRNFHATTTGKLGRHCFDNAAEAERCQSFSYNSHRNTIREPSARQQRGTVAHAGDMGMYPPPTDPEIQNSNSSPYSRSLFSLSFSLLASSHNSKTAIGDNTPNPHIARWKGRTVTDPGRYVRSS